MLSLTSFVNLNGTLFKKTTFVLIEKIKKCSIDKVAHKKPPISLYGAILLVYFYPINYLCMD